jgi:DNA-binding response OmpR family regulator
MSEPSLNGLGHHPRAKVLVVDDEPAIGDVVSRYLTRAGYETAVATTGGDALGHAERDHKRAAIILLTARKEESDRIIGLRLGADDYVIKPFSPGELVARVDALLRRIEPVDERQPPLRFDGLEIDPAGRRVLRDGEQLELTQREFELLLFLARHPGQAFTRDQLMERVWEYTFYIDTSTVTVHIRRLRAKLESDPARPRFIQTVWGVGYRFAP